MNHAENLQAILADHSRTHNNYQIDRFIVAKAGLTDWGRYVQAMRELNGRRAGMIRAHIKREELLLDLEEAEESSRKRHGREAARAHLEARKLRHRLQDHEERVRGLWYEFSRFYLLASRLKEKFGDLSQEDRERHGRELMLAQVRYAIAACVWGEEPKRAWGMLRCLPPEDRRVAQEWFRNPKAQEEHFLAMPEPVEALPPTSEEMEAIRLSVGGQIRAELLLDDPPADCGDGQPASDPDALPRRVLSGHPH